MSLRTAPATGLVAVNFTEGARVIASGAVVGGVGAVAFAPVHAMAILPIRGRIPGGLVQAIPAGIALTFAFEHRALATTAILRHIASRYAAAEHTP